MRAKQEARQQVLKYQRLALAYLFSARHLRLLRQPQERSPDALGL
jgi:hypothetical protein